MHHSLPPIPHKPSETYEKVLEISLENIFSTHLCEDLITHFKDYAIPAVRLASMKALSLENVVKSPDVSGGSFQFIMEGINEPSPDGSSILYATNQPCNASGGYIYQTAMVPIRTRSKTGMRFLHASQKYGASTRSILKDLGYTDEEVNNLIKRGRASDGWCDHYFP